MASASAKKEQEGEIRVCDICKKDLGPKDIRYYCPECPDFDACHGCDLKHEHALFRYMPKTTQIEKCKILVKQAVLSIQSALKSKSVESNASAATGHLKTVSRLLSGMEDGDDSGDDDEEGASDSDSAASAPRRFLDGAK